MNGYSKAVLILIFITGESKNIFKLCQNPKKDPGLSPIK